MMESSGVSVWCERTDPCNGVIMGVWCERTDPCYRVIMGVCMV